MQAVAVYQLLLGIDEHSTIHDPKLYCLGVAFMSLFDEWWKSKPGDARHFDTQNLGGKKIDMAYDGFSDEEYLGWLKLIVKNRRVVGVEAKKVYHLMQRVWTGVPMLPGRFANIPLPDVKVDVQAALNPSRTAQTWHTPSGERMLELEKGRGVKRPSLQRDTYALPELLPSLRRAMPLKPVSLPGPAATVRTFVQPKLVQGNDFLYFYVRDVDGAVELVLSDVTGKELTVKDELFWWPLQFNQIFIPDMDDPAEIVSVTASPRDVRKRRVFAVSIAELYRLARDQGTGMNLEQLRAITVKITGQTLPNPHLSDIGVLGNGERASSDRVKWGRQLPLITPAQTPVQTIRVQGLRFGDGNRIIITLKDPDGSTRNLTVDLSLLGPAEVLAVGIERQPRVLSKDRGAHEMVVPANAADPSQPVSLAFSIEHGRALSGIWTAHRSPDGSLLLTKLPTSNAFQFPEIQMHGQEDVQPGRPRTIAFYGGGGTVVVFPMDKPGMIANAGASLPVALINQVQGRQDQRLPLSPVKQAWLDTMTQATNTAALLYDFPEIDRPRNDRPYWTQQAAAAGVAPRVSDERLRPWFEQETKDFDQRRRQGKPTWFRTSLGTPANTAQIVSTVKQLEEIVPALLRLGMTAQARQVVESYLARSGNGQKLVADFYDRESGNPSFYDAYHNTTSQHFRSTSESQVAMINALLMLAEAAADPTEAARHLEAAHNFLDRLLEFHPEVAGAMRLNGTTMPTPDPPR
jgi:hypothetical protein